MARPEVTAPFRVTTTLTVYSRDVYFIVPGRIPGRLEFHSLKKDVNTEDTERSNVVFDFLRDLRDQVFFRTQNRKTTCPLCT